MQELKPQYSKIHMYTKKIFWGFVWFFPLLTWGQHLGLINQINPYDSVSERLEIPIYPKISSSPMLGKTSRLLPLVDLALNPLPPIEAKGRFGVLYDISKNHFFARIGGFIGASTTPNNLREPYLILANKNQGIAHIDPMMRIGVNANRLVSIQAGYDRNFYGDGFRSLMLSDAGSPYPFTSLRFNAGPLTYQFMGMYLSSTNYQKKYSINHFLNWKPTKNLQGYLFETVLFNSNDTINYRGFDPNYLNPFVVIRPTEYASGSGDNVLLGGGFSVKYKKSKFYGQFIIDDLLISALFNKQKYWGNKFGGQLGWKYYGKFHEGVLHLRLEANAIRPYTYAHIGDQLNYSHNGQVLAHPNGANFWELFFRGDYLKRSWIILTELAVGEKGLGLSYGGDINSPYTLRPSDFSIYTLQGLTTSQFNARIQIAYQLNCLYKLQLFTELLSTYFINNSSQKLMICPFIGIKTNVWNDYRF